MAFPSSAVLSQNGPQYPMVSATFFERADSTDSPLFWFSPVVAAVVARILLEHLADFVLASCRNASTQQEHLDSASLTVLPWIEETVRKKLAQLDQETAKSQKREKDREGKKRKASTSPQGAEESGYVVFLCLCLYPCLIVLSP